MKSAKTKRNISAMLAAALCACGIITASCAGSGASSVKEALADDGIVFQTSDSQSIEALTVTAGSSYTVTLASGEEDGTWSTGDSAVATVKKTDSGATVTGESEGETILTYTENDETKEIPVKVKNYGRGEETKTFNIYVSEITDTTAYMGVIYGESDSSAEVVDFCEVTEGEVIYLEFPSDSGAAVDFFGAPDEGYALTLLSSTNSNYDYMAINSDNPSETDFITEEDAAGYSQYKYFGSVAYNLVQKAIDAGCDGGMGWTRPSSNTNSASSEIIIRSQKLPTIEKEITSVTSNGETSAYTGQDIYAGDTLNYTVTVTQYATTEAISYDNEELTDKLTADSSERSISLASDALELSDETVSENVSYQYTASYEIQSEDEGTELKNTASLSFTYKAAYSSASKTASASAEAEIKVSQKTYEIAFDGNYDGCSQTMENQTMEYNVSGSLNANTFTRNGYAFTGWNTAEDGLGTSYNDGQEVTNLVNEDGSTVTLYAQWTANSYKIIYDPNGGEGDSYNESVTYDSTWDASDCLDADGNCIFAKTGYALIGWSYTADGSADIELGQESMDAYNSGNYAIDDDLNLTLYAVWQEDTAESTDTSTDENADNSTEDSDTGTNKDTDSGETDDTEESADTDSDTEEDTDSETDSDTEEDTDSETDEDTDNESAEETTAEGTGDAKGTAAYAVISLIAAGAIVEAKRRKGKTE